MSKEFRNLPARCAKWIGEPDVQQLLGLLRISDEEAVNHSVDVAVLVEECIDQMKKDDILPWTEEECMQIVKGSLLHDIGKSHLPFNLQHNSAKLTVYERSIIDMHPVLGYEAIVGLSSLDDEEDNVVSPIVRQIILQHHANLDGTGYPLIDKVPYDATNVKDYVWLVAYADRFLGMTTKRSYKSAKSFPEAWTILNNMIARKELPYMYKEIFLKVIQRHSIYQIR